MTTPDPSVAPAARVPSNVSGMSISSGVTNTPAAPPSRTACSGRAVADAAGQIDQLAQRDAERRFVEPGRARRSPDTQNSLVPADPGVPTAANAGPPVEDDVEHVDQRLDVVDDRRLAEEAGLDRERRLVARLAAQPLDRIEQRGFLAADVGAARRAAARDRSARRRRSRCRRAGPRSRAWSMAPLPAAPSPADTRRGCR